jgi:hypothetical protein
VRSFDALAIALLGSDGWPHDTSVKARSLAALLGKLDRGQELEWLTARPTVRQLLAQVLGVPVAAIDGAVRQDASSVQAGRLVRLEDLPDARPIDLIVEPLFPGLPEAVLEPSRWGRIWWRASSGAGRSLVGRWLEARGLARFRRGFSGEDVLSAVPGAGAAFLEIESDDYRGERLAARLAGIDRICIAAPFSPADASDWQIVLSPAPEHYLPALVEWIAARLPADGQFEADAALRWLDAGPVAQGLIDSAGTAIGISGAIDRAGVKKLRSKSARWLAEHFFAERVPGSDAASVWLKRAGIDVCIALARRLLTDSELPWDAPRRFDQWLELLLPEVGHTIDPDWIKLALAPGGAVRPSDIDKAARRLPPGAYRAVRALQNASLLRARSNDDRLRLAPRWFANLLIEQAKTELVSGSPIEWGEAMLRPHAAGEVMRALFGRVRRDPEVIEPLLDLEPDQSLAYAAASYAAFCASGLALLAGAELATEQLESLWNEQLERTLVFDGALPRPLLELAASHAQLSAPMLSLGAFYLAALAISEQLPQGVGNDHASLRPWSLSEPPSELGRVLDDIFAIVCSEQLDDDVALAAFDLADRLRHTIGSSSHAGSPHPLEQPGLILDEAAHQVLDWKTVSTLDHGELIVRALEWLARRRRIDFADVAQAVWRAWDTADRPPLHTTLLDAKTRWAHAFWRHLPEELLEVVISRSEGVVFDALSDRHWQLLLEAACARRIVLGPAAWQAIPVSLVATSSVVAELPDAALSELYQRMPDEMIALAATTEVAPALELLMAAPLDQTAAVTEYCSAMPLFELPSPLLDRLRRDLHRRIAARSPAWQGACELLLRIERGLRPARKLSMRP